LFFANLFERPREAVSCSRAWKKGKKGSKTNVTFAWLDRDMALCLTGTFPKVSCETGISLSKIMLVPVSQLACDQRIKKVSEPNVTRLIL
jgi:hypothetical protein